MIGISTYLSVITLNANGLNSSVKSIMSIWHIGLKKQQKFIYHRKDKYMSKWRVENDIPRKFKMKVSRSSHIYIWQSNDQTNTSQMRQRSLHIDKGNIASKVYDNCKDIQRKHWPLNFIK
jgi:hypothetical protein